MAQNNTFSTLGRSGNLYNRSSGYNDQETNTLGRGGGVSGNANGNRYSEVPIANPLFQR